MGSPRGVVTVDIIDHEWGPYWYLELDCGHKAERTPRRPRFGDVPWVWPQDPPAEVNCWECP